MPRYVVAEDFNQDGYPDLALACHSCNTVTFLQNLAAQMANPCEAFDVSLTADWLLDDAPMALAAGNMLDAPVSGGQAGAENGALTVMCGGDATSFAKAEPVMAAYGRSVKRLGDVASGQLTKMVNQICIAGLLQGLSEAVDFAQAAGLDTDAVVDVISKGAAQSWQMENRWHTMAKGEFDFGFAVDWMRKDLAICLEEARRNGAPLPVTALVDQFYREVQMAGGERWDTSSLVHNLRGPRGGQGS